MTRVIGRIVETRMEMGGCVSGKIHLPRSLHTKPGQYLLARRVDGFDILPVAIFGAHSEDSFFYTSSSLPADWGAGTQVYLRGPLGNGFSLPPLARRVFLAAAHPGEIFMLSPLMRQAIEQWADVAILAEGGVVDLPAEVELVTTGQFHDALRWADFAAVQTTVEHLADLCMTLGLTGDKNGGCPIQVLVHFSFACGGSAACGACAVKTRQGWKLACKDGPVFDFDDLEVE